MSVLITLPSNSFPGLTLNRVPVVGAGGKLVDFSTFVFSPGAGIVIANGFNGALNGSVGATTPAAGIFTTLKYGSMAAGPTDITNGTYTPTASATVNLDSTPTMQVAQYSQNAAVVTVSGRFIANPTLAATTTSFEFTLPVSTGFDQDYRLGGTAFCGSIAGMGAEIYASTISTTNALVSWKSSDINSQTWSYILQYFVQPAI